MINSEPLEDRVAIVTGAAAGIGRASAELLARAGARVVVADIDGAGAEKAVAAIRDSGGHAVPYAVDISHESRVRAMVEFTSTQFGALHVLHNNAALITQEQHARDGTVVDMDIEVWNRQLSVTLTGTMLCCKHAIPLMLRSGGGSIVNMSSAASLSGDLTITAYAAAKAGVNSLTRSIATAFGPRGIRCNAIAPGLVLTQNTQRKVPAELLPVFQANVLAPRLGEPEDLANVVLFLASDSSFYINGQVIPVDGGMLTHQPHVERLRESGLRLVPPPSGPGDTLASSS